MRYALLALALALVGCAVDVDEQPPDELGHLSGCTHSSSVGENTMSPKAQTGAMVWSFEDDEACGLR